MASLPRFNGVVQDDAGNGVSGAHIEVRLDVSGQPLVQLYSDRAGAVAVGNPIDADSSGVFGFFVDLIGEYQIRAYTGSSGSPTFERILRYVQIGVEAVRGPMETETQITGASYDLGSTETFLTIRRTTPTLTTINLPALASRTGLECAFVDWSTISSDHEIKFVPYSGETVMKDANYSVWSNSSSRARGFIYPAPDLSSWVVTS